MEPGYAGSRDVITVYADRSFSFETKTPPASYFLKKAAQSLGKGSASRSRRSDPVGSVTMDQLREIAEKKKEDLNANDVDAACKILAGIGALDGYFRGGVSYGHGEKGKRFTKAQRGTIDRETRMPVTEAVKAIKERAVAKFDETIEMSFNLGRRSRAMPIRRFAARSRCRTVLASRCGSRSSPRATKSRKPRPRAPTWLARKTWPKPCKSGEINFERVSLQRRT